MRPELFTVNVLGDYGEFPEFRETIKHALTAFYEVATPTALKRLGIRYINFLPADAIAAAGKALRIETSFPRTCFRQDPRSPCGASSLSQGERRARSRQR